MIILHCTSRSAWQRSKNQPYYGHEMLESEGFIHCSSIEYFWRVAPNFLETDEELVLLCIESVDLEAELRWEDSDHCGREYPHVYGLINTSAVKQVLEYHKLSNGSWQKNEELMDYQDM